MALRYAQYFTEAFGALEARLATAQALEATHIYLAFGPWFVDDAPLSHTPTAPRPGLEPDIPALCSTFAASAAAERAVGHGGSNDGTESGATATSTALPRMRWLGTTPRRVGPTEMQATLPHRHRLNVWGACSLPRWQVRRQALHRPSM